MNIPPERWAWTPPHVERARGRLNAASQHMLAALKECVTEPGAACHRNPEWMERRLQAINEVAKAAITEATGRPA